MSDLHLWGGGERVAIMMANHYAAKGVDSTLLSVGRSSGGFRFKIDPNVTVNYLNIQLESRWKLLRKIEAVFAMRNYFRIIRDKSSVGGVSNLNPPEENPTMLICIGLFPILLAAMIIKENQLIRTIGSLHSPYRAQRHIWKFLRWLLYYRMDILVALTLRDLPKFKRHNPNVLAIPNPLTFYPNQAATLETKLILAVGRIDYPKGYDLMLEVFALFCKKNLDWNLKIIGEGPLKADIEKLAKKKGISDRLTIAPATNQIEKEYINASIYLMTSRSEGLPMVLLEAQACGLPIVAFDCETGPAEIVNHGVDGFLVRPNESEEMSERLLELASDPHQRKAFGAAARQNVKRFLPEEIFQKWDDLFDDLCT